MKIAVILGEWSLSTRPLDFWFDNIWTSGRGLTGTDLSFCIISSELQKLGHEIHMFTKNAQPNNKPDIWQGCKLYNFIERHTVIDESFDAVISINEPDALRGVNEKPFRICWQFLNDFTYCQSGYDDYVDLWLGVCDQHTKHLQRQAPKPEKWQTLALGCDPSWYEDNKKVPGRMIFCSSADRGLHLALQAFPKIKEQVPEASLKIFYHFQEGPVLKIEPNSTTDHPHVTELGHRLRYCREAIKRMKNMGVEQIGSVSVEEMKRQMSEASVLLYPVDTVAFSEGFSLSIMQAHAAGAIPAISSADCIGGIYRHSGCLMTEMPVATKLNEYAAGVVKALTDITFANNARDKCKLFAQKYLWTNIANKMCKLIEDNPKHSNTLSIPNISGSKTPAISIIMPTMRPGGLDIVFKSLERQTFKNFELILVDGIYKHRKDIVAQESKKYDFIVKHVEPIKNVFPISCLAHTTNTGFVNASASLVLMITDYTYLPTDCVEKHIKFHNINLAENMGYMCPHQYKSLPELHPDFTPYQNEDTDLFVSDIITGKLNHLMWSIFKEPFDQDPEALSLDSMGNADTKLFMPYGPGDHQAFNAKNESLKIEAALKVNGWDEELDGAHLCQDNVFSDILVKKLGFTWIVDKDNKVYIINPRFVMPHARRIRHHMSNYPIWRRKQANNFSDPVNDWSLREMRGVILQVAQI
jgi:glycosyltransferase involved in cell wall biosynthesis